MGFEDTWDRDLIGNQNTQKRLKARVRDSEHGRLILGGALQATAVKEQPGQRAMTLPYGRRGQTGAKTVGVPLLHPLPHKNRFRFDACNLLHRSGQGKSIAGQFEETLLRRSDPVWS
jgi:hypothetical protein